MTTSELQPSDVQKMLLEHSVFFHSKKTKSLEFRIEQLQKLRAAIINYESKLIDALHRDLGKHPFETYASEVGFVLNSIKHTIKSLKKWVKPKKVRTPFVLYPSKSFIMYEPYGTVLIIGPFNYPFQLLIEPMIGAIAAGNCVVLKPSEVVPNVSEVITEMIQSIFDPAYIRSVEGGIETNTSLINSPFDYIFFTGSIPVGKIVMEAAAKNLVPVTLELGGKSPVIVDETAKIQIAADRIVWGKTLNSGQTCVAPDYLMVHESIKEELIQEIKNSLQKFYGMDIQTSKDFGRIVSDRHFKRLETMLEEDKHGILYGGSKNAETRFMEPTLIDASWDCATMSEEIFGPLLPILTYKDLDEAIVSIKKRSKPLALYLFTTNKKVEEKVLSEVSSGGVSINDTITHLANPELPFGGVGHSGIGAYHGKYSFLTFSHEKSVLRKSNKVKLTMLYPPYNQKKLNLIKRFLK
ncbi:aldehyde dehydrogenase [Cytobacillus sp. FJAT-54145]|uniref:Aldehyde dehydrogenase n=1 Tax=Cytobacillus spartinae TaxID=3299023 RepID=A0ABW6KFD7_9BACI